MPTTVIEYPTPEQAELAGPRQTKIWWDSLLRGPETAEEMKAMHIIARKHEIYYGHLNKDF